MGHFAVAASVQLNIESAAKVLMALCFSRVAFAQLFAEKCDAVEGTGGVCCSSQSNAQSSCRVASAGPYENPNVL